MGGALLAGESEQKNEHRSFSIQKLPPKSLNSEPRPLATGVFEI
jgi:hypothetical protein